MSSGKFIFAIIGFMFLAGFGLGFFIQGSTLIKAENRIDQASDNLSELQLEYLLLSQSSQAFCPILKESLLETSIELTGVVEELQRTSPADPLFEVTKTKADDLTMKAWLLGTTLEDRCADGLVTSLFLFSHHCEKCERQNEILQSQKDENFLVFAIEFETDDRVFNLIKESYEIEESPVAIIRGGLYTFNNTQELIDLLDALDAQETA